MTLPSYEGYDGGSRSDAKVVLRKRDGNMHGDGDKVFPKDFSKTPVGATDALGDDDELGHYLVEK